MDLFPWFTRVVQGAEFRRMGSVTALHVLNVGSVDKDGNKSTPNDALDEFVKEYHIILEDDSGADWTLLDIRDALGVDRILIGQYYIRVYVMLDTDGDGVPGDDFDFNLVADGVGAETAQIQIVNYGQPGYVGAEYFRMDCAYDPTKDSAWRTLVGSHPQWAAGETHVTHIMVQIWRKTQAITHKLVT